MYGDRHVKVSPDFVARPFKVAFGSGRQVEGNTFRREGSCGGKADAL
jgi:hypothetical protein